MLRVADMNVEKGFRAAEEITRRFAKTFYFASHFLPIEKRYAAYAVYAVCRISDETVDGGSHADPRAQLRIIKEHISAAYGTGVLENSIWAAFRETVMTYQIPQRYFDGLLAGMEMDLVKCRYANFSELYEYCYNVAGVVGLIMVKIFGYDDLVAEEHAVELGVAMQLTNILRDIKEDYSRGRVYLPRDEMRDFGINEEALAHGEVTDAWRVFMRFKIAQAREYYGDSAAGVPFIIDRRSRFVTRAMGAVYARILTAIEANGYDIFSRRAQVSTLKKILVVLSLLFSK